jgi:uncharacterized membrane protein
MRIPRHLLLALLIAFSACASAGPHGWRFIDLGSLPGAVGSVALAVNKHGEVAGDSGARGFVWENGSMLDIGVPPGNGEFSVMAMNEHGQVIGCGDTGEAWTWRDGAWDYLGFRGIPTGINKFGDVAGTVAFDDFVNLCAADPADKFRGRRAVLLRDARLIDLGALGGGSRSWAYAVNDRRQVVGRSLELFAHDTRAFIWESGVMGLLASGEVATDINNRGQAVLYSQNYDGSWGWFNDGTSAHFLFKGAIPLALNDLGDVVGEIRRLGLVSGFLLEDGVVTLLDQLPEVAAAGFTRLFPQDINTRGWITGYGFKDGFFVAAAPTAFLLIPKE